MSDREALSAYRRIVRNAALGTGTHLTAEETWVLAQDHAVSEAALSEDDKVPSRTPFRGEEAPDE
jgi:hypothetical protein